MRCDSGGGWCPPVEYSVHGISPGNPEWAPNSLPWEDIFKRYFGSNNKIGKRDSLRAVLRKLAVKWDLNQKLSNKTTSYWQYWII